MSKFIYKLVLPNKEEHRILIEENDINSLYLENKFKEITGKELTCNGSLKEEGYRLYYLGVEE